MHEKVFPLSAHLSYGRYWVGVKSEENSVIMKRIHDFLIKTTCNKIHTSKKNTHIHIYIYICLGMGCVKFF